MTEIKFNHVQDNWLEVSWTAVVQLPDTIHPEEPAVYEMVSDEFGNPQPGRLLKEAVPETVTPGEIQRTELRHTSYHPSQLDLLQADADAMGTPLDAHADMLAAWVASYVAPPVVPPTVADFEAALTAHLDTTARARRYDSRISCALRAGYPGPFQAEGQAFAAWMDACNAQAYALLAEVQAGTRPLPTTTQALIEVLPAMEWPA